MDILTGLSPALPEMLTTPLLLASVVDTIVNILYVALGLGLVIFFHELGHFAVAKWCNVHVERFSIGFGPILWAFKKGETEYALSAVPFGGYVKMLGQDDMDPSQLTQEEIARDPRAYSSKSVSQRMAIISAGVIMNVLTAVLFFGFALGLGLRVNPAAVGDVQPGLPAWQAGLRTGDTITEINGHEIQIFNDIFRRVALSRGDLLIEGRRADGSPFTVTVAPSDRGIRRMIGVGPSHSLTLYQGEATVVPQAVVPGTPAAEARPAFEPGDTIRKVGDVEVASYAELEDLLARHRDEPLEFEVERTRGERTGRATVTVEANPFRTLGLWMEIGRISAVQHRSPAADAGLRPGDRIIRVNDRAVGTDLDPLQLPDDFWKLRGQEVEVVVSRPASGGDPKELTFRLEPVDRPGWIEQPKGENVPLSVPAIGVAYQVIPTVLKVEEGSPAEKVGVRPGERVRKIELVRPADTPPDGFRENPYLVDFADKDKKDSNWAFAFWLMQAMPTRQVTLTVANAAGETRAVEITPAPSATREWYATTRGLALHYESMELKADGVGEALVLGVRHTRNTLFDTYLMVRSLLTGWISPLNLQGPVGIARIGYSMATEGPAALLLFLGVLSVNLAVINFLPIPVLDGGHMVFLLWEAVTRKKPSERVIVAATYAGLLFILGLMMFVLYLDIFVHT